MKKIILSYLNKNYRLTFSTYVSYLLEDKMDKSYVTVKDVLQSIKLIFDIDEDELTSFFDEWAEISKNILDDKLHALRQKLLETTGVPLTLTPDDINKLLDAEDNLSLNGASTSDKEFEVPVV